MLDDITTQPPLPKFIMLRQSMQRLEQHRPRDTTNAIELSEVPALRHREDTVSARTHAAMSLIKTRHTPTQCQGNNLASLAHPIHLPRYSSAHKPPARNSAYLFFIETSRTRPKPQPAHRAPHAPDTAQSQPLRPRTPSQRPYRRTTPFTMPCTWQ
jgi:hypothetical protein